MKYSQLYMLMGTMHFVGSLLTHNLSSSLLLFGMATYWYICAIIFLKKESELLRVEKKLERLKDQYVIEFLENIKLNLEQIRLTNSKKKK